MEAENKNEECLEELYGQKLSLQSERINIVQNLRIFVKGFLEETADVTSTSAHSAVSYLSKFAVEAEDNIQNINHKLLYVLSDIDKLEHKQNPS